MLCGCLDDSLLIAGWVTGLARTTTKSHSSNLPCDEETCSNLVPYFLLKFCLCSISTLPLGAGQGLHHQLPPALHHHPRQQRVRPAPVPGEAHPQGAPTAPLDPRSPGDPVRAGRKTNIWHSRTHQWTVTLTSP